jgi:predicted amidohydrolase
MKVAACQMPDVRNDVQRAVSLIQSYATEAERQGARLVCFPECFLQGYDVRAEYVAQAALDLASAEFAHVLRSLETCEPIVVVGLLERQGAKFYNSALAIDRGRVVARYRKAHLLDGERAVFEAGADYPVFEAHGTTVGINICYDLTFSDAINAVADAGAELVACPCNNMMDRRTAEEWKLRHDPIRADRAREGRVWLLSSDVTGEWGDRISYGPTAVIDPSGNVIDQVPLMTTGMVIAELSDVRGGV